MYFGSLFGFRASSTFLVFGCLSLTPFAIVLYWLRRAFRLWYGMFEYAVACVTLAVVVRNTMGAVPISEQNYESFAARWVSILAVMYLMVRSLDNIGEGFRPGKWQDRWNRWFPKT